MRHHCKCVVCGTPFVSRNKTKKFCQDHCKKIQNQKDQQERRDRERLDQSPDPFRGNPSRKGDISEMEICVKYLKEGWEVFKNVSSVGPCDIIIWNPTTKEMKLIDVKSYSTRKFLTVEQGKGIKEKLHEDITVLLYQTETKDFLMVD